MFDDNLDSCLLDGMHEMHKAAIYNWWVAEVDKCKKLRANHWPPQMSVILGIFRAPENWNTFKDDLPHMGK